MKVKVNQETCIGCGACAATCPETFEIKDGKAHVKNEDCGGCDCKGAADACPVNAITVEE